MEIVIVDDGSPEPPRLGEYPWSVRVVTLPQKKEPMCPCVPCNIGVSLARGDAVLLTGPEIIHRTPILQGMRAKLGELGPKGYVSAAVWGGWWYCHSRLMPPDKAVGRAPSPKGAALHFCAMLHKDFFNEVGGFDEQYRNGAGFDDNDFLWSLDRAGAKFAICDDLIADHIPCPRCEWPEGGFGRNQAIFKAKWERTLQNA